MFFVCCHSLIELDPGLMLFDHAIGDESFNMIENTRNLDRLFAPFGNLKVMLQRWDSGDGPTSNGNLFGSVFSNPFCCCCACLYGMLVMHSDKDLCSFLTTKSNLSKTYRQQRLLENENRSHSYIFVFLQNVHEPCFTPAANYYFFHCAQKRIGFEIYLVRNFFVNCSQYPQYGYLKIKKLIHLDHLRIPCDRNFCIDVHNGQEKQKAKSK